MSVAKSCFVPSFTYWNVSAMLPLIKIIKYMIKYFIGPITLQAMPVGSECILQISTCVVQHITPGKEACVQAFRKPHSWVPRCWLRGTTGLSVGKGARMLCGQLYIKLYISSKTQSKWMMDEVTWKLLIITLSPLKSITLYTMTISLTFGTKSPSLKSSQTFCKLCFQYSHWYQKAMRQIGKLDTEAFSDRKYTRCGHSTC